MSGEAPVKLYSRAALLTATFFGTPFIGFLLLSVNFKRLGDPRRARWAALGGVLFLVALFLFLILVPESVQNSIPSAVYWIVQLALLGGIHQAWQEPTAREAIAAGRAVSGSWGKAILAGLGGLVLYAAIFLALVWLGFFPPFEGEHFQYGTYAHDIYYKDVTREEADRVVAALDGAGHFNLFNFQIFFQIQKQNDRLQIVFPFEDGEVLKPENQGYFRELKSRLLQDFNLDVDIVLTYDSWDGPQEAII